MECPPGIHSMFDFCPGNCTEDEEDEMVRGAKGGEDQEKDLDEAARRFESTLGGNEPPDQE